MKTEGQIRKKLSAIKSPYNQENKMALYKLLQNAIETKIRKLEAEVRFYYFQQLVFLHEKDEAFIHYSWLLNWYKKYRDTEALELGFEVIWGFKWIIDDVNEYADISLQKSEALWKEFEELYTSQSGFKMIQFYAIDYHLNLGQPEPAMLAYKNYKAIKRPTAYENCMACQKHTILNMNVTMGKYKMGLKKYNEVIKQNYSCGQVPKITFPVMCFAQLMLGNMTEAETFYKLTMTNNNLEDIDPYVFKNVLYYLAIQNDFAGGAKIIKQQLKGVFKTKNDLSNLKFLHACHFFFEKMKSYGHSGLTLKIEELNHLPNKGGKYSFETLSDWSNQQFQYHCKRINDRNGNVFWSNYFKDLDKKLKQINHNRSQK